MTSNDDKKTDDLSTPYVSSCLACGENTANPKRRITMSVILSFLLATVVAIGVRVQFALGRPGPLRFRLDSDESASANKKRTFTILQLTDIHTGERADTDWGPEQDRKTWAAIAKYLDQESPDLIVFTGDQLTAGDVNRNATAYYRLLGERISAYGIPFALIFGNHDVEALQVWGEQGNASTIHYYSPKTSRRQLLQALGRFPLSVTPPRPRRDLPGNSNYALKVYTEGKTLGAKLLFLDTGGGDLPEQIVSSQLQFLNKELDEAEDIPTVVFMHIPTEDFIYQQEAGDGNSCVGENGDEGIAPISEDAGIVSALTKSGRVHFLAVGHNHGNDYCCQTSGILHLCFGRHSGYGGYGSWDKGARLYELVLQENSYFQWNSWVRLEDGSVVDKISVSSSE